MFWNLVKHELKHRSSEKDKNSSHKRYIKYIYLVVFLVIAFVFITKLALAGELDPTQIWNVLYGLPFALIGISRAIIKREQRCNTVGWWLSLPFRRQTLIWAKFLAAMWRSILTYLIIFVLGLVGFFYALLIDPKLQLHDIGNFLLTGANVGLIMIVIGPLVIALGMFIGILALTEYRYLVSLFWIGFWVVWALVISSYAEVIFHFIKHQYAAFPGVSFIAWLPCWIITYILIVFMSVLLERKLV
ncbi:hypothetical protein MK805_02660 [Shimazuella sp. AN120528]|uniref:hypothetical protein n=1 Tax=Shimazuella soli TaxID=1892854 RepID=UPI001F0DEE8C|nr:hypothetical protein [Shimazuella soli]MCH5583869.1 hypothetical protein [Shimazuella soli]